MKRVRFIYLRHGKTEFNRDGIIQGGRVDSPLDTASLDAVRNAGEALRDVDIRRCYVSPQGRAIKTAEISLQNRDIPMQIVDGLHEVDFGSLDGLPYKGNTLQFASCFFRQDFSSVGGERGSEVIARIDHTFGELYEAADDGDDVLVVAHGALLRYVMRAYAPGPRFWRRARSEVMKAKNASLTTIIGQDGTFVLAQGPLDAEKWLSSQKAR